MKKILLGLLLFFVTASYGYCSVRITPTYVELDANKTKKDYVTGSFNVRGGKDEVIRFKIYPKFFKITKRGDMEVIEPKGQKNSLVNRVKFFPSEFTCKNGKNQKVRFTCMDLKNLPDGESRLVFFLEDVNTREVFVKSKDGKHSGKIIVKTRVGVPVYVDKGKYTKKGSLERVALRMDKGKYVCEYKVLGLGNSKIRLSGIAQVIQGKKLISECNISKKAVGANGFIEVGQILEIPKDKLNKNENYKLKLILTYLNEKQKEKVLVKEILFTPNKVDSI